MKTIKYMTLSVLLLALGFAFSSCTDLSVDNLNDPGREDALSNPADLVSLLEGQTVEQFWEENSYNGIQMDGLADQMTSTNNVAEFWDHADEPRRRINNRTSFPSTFIYEYDWDESNSSVSTANTIISRIEKDGKSIVLEDGTDVTQKMLAGAYFLRGLARGSLGMTYDQAYLIGIDADLSQTPEFSPYVDLINGAVSDMDKAISVAEGVGSGFRWDFLPDATNTELNLAEFKTVANSFSARFLANTPRTASESANWDWARVIDYAEKGIGGDNAAAPGMDEFTASSISGEFYNHSADWQSYIYPPPAGYLPRDIKLPHLLDDNGDYPVEYPSVVIDGTAVPDTLKPGDLQTSDPRIEYLFYSESFGYLDPSRSIVLHSNYTDARMHYNNQVWSTSGLPVNFFIEAELDYIRAEAYLMDGNKAAAATELNNSPYGSGQTDVEPNFPAVQLGNMSQDGFSGGHSISATASKEEFIKALHLEYSIELSMIDRKGLQWFFMRKHDLLQKGTALHFAVPGSELEITQREYYTFGGVDYADQEGTATGSNSWKLNAAKVQQKAKVAPGKYNATRITEDMLNNLSTSSTDNKGKHN